MKLQNKFLQKFKNIITPPYKNAKILVVSATVLLLLGTIAITVALQNNNHSTAQAATINSVEPEDGTITGNVTIENDANASGGKYIKFGAITATPRPIQTVDVRSFGAVGDGRDDSVAIQSALDSGADVVTLGSEGVFLASVSVPSNVTFKSTGAVLKPVSGTIWVVASGGDGAIMEGLRVDATVESNMVGQERAFSISHSDVRLSNSSVTANGYRYGVYIESPNRLANIVIQNNTFDTTSYGIFKQNTALDYALVDNNTLRNIRRGDAIEFNMGLDTGTRITNNDIDGVYADGFTFAGLGIGVAGYGDYNRPYQDMTSNYVISGNTVKNVDNEAIHLEVMAHTIIENNVVEQTVNPQTGVGIVFYGSGYITARSNTVRNFNIGIWEAYGVINGEYVVRDGQNTIENNNIIENCTIPIEYPPVF